LGAMQGRRERRGVGTPNSGGGTVQKSVGKGGGQRKKRVGQSNPVTDQRGRRGKNAKLSMLKGAVAARGRRGCITHGGARVHEMGPRQRRGNKWEEPSLH